MKFKITLKYIYADYNPSTNPISNIFHHIDSEIVTQYANQNHFILHKSDFVELLQADGALFDPDCMRIFSEDEQAFYLLTDEFDIQIDQSVGPIELILWLRPPKPFDAQAKIEALVNDVQNLIKNVNNIDLQVQELQKSHKSLSEQLQTTTSQVQAITTSLPSNQSSVISSQLSSKNLLFPPLGLQRSDSKISLARSDTGGLDNLPLLHQPSLQTVKSTVSSYEPSISDSPMPGLQKKRSFIDSSKLPNVGTIDMAILYSEPLVRKVENGVEPLGDPVDFEEESNKLLEILKAKNKRIDLIFQIATKDRLVDVLAKGPSILHIICHGEYSKQEKQFYLCFEGENGELLEFFSENLRSIIEKIEISSVKLVFVNACHSEEVAKVFVQAGVPCVIAIQSELRIADSVAQKFSQHFYNHIFDGMAIKPAFELAKVAASSMDLNTCCCAHTHKADCPWYKDLALKESFKKAHQYHEPLCLDCPKRNKHIHNGSCKWAQDFQFTYKLDPFDAPSGVSDNEIWTCCCSPELPHNESLKFKKFCQNELSDQMVLFANRESGVVTNKNPYSVIEQKFSVKRIMGRNREMHQLYEILTNKELKFVQLNGSEGVGKTSLVKQLANYLYERGHFRDKISIIMMEKTPSISHFKSDLYKEVPGAYDFKSFCESIKLSKILFILEKCDMLLENHKKDFIEILKQVAEAAKYTKFIIIKNEYERLQLDESLVMMRDLQPIDAAKILLNLSYKYLKIKDRKLDDLAQRPLFQKIRLTPQKIWCISERLKHESLDYIESEMIFGQESSYKTKAEENEEAIGKTLQ